jgi:hypothetical protein
MEVYYIIYSMVTSIITVRVNLRSRKVKKCGVKSNQKGLIEE